MTTSTEDLLQETVFRIADNGRSATVCVVEYLPGLPSRHRVSLIECQGGEGELLDELYSKDGEVDGRGVRYAVGAQALCSFLEHSLKMDLPHS